MSDLESPSDRAFDEHYPGPRDSALGVKTVFGGDPRERYRQVALKRVLDHLNGRPPSPLPPFPNGWFAIAFSADLAPREVRPMSLFAQDVVLYRGKSGRAHLLDAHCPHLGAHLGHGGKVAGDELVCPFHAWTFAGDWRCTRVPYSGEIPAGAAVRAWPLLERNGLLFAWHHAERKPPDWEPSALPEFSDSDYRIAGLRCTHFTAHLQDVVENGVDLPHFRVVHLWEADRVEWSVSGHTYRMAYRIGHMRDQSHEVPALSSTTEGPGYTYTRFAGRLAGVGTHAMTPVEPGVFQLMQLYCFHRSVPDALCERAVESSSLEWASDIPIWENKRTWLRPRLTGDDGPIAAYRRWFNQFYSEPVDQGRVEEGSLRNVVPLGEGSYAMGPSVRREREAAGEGDARASDREPPPDR